MYIIHSGPFVTLNRPLHVRHPVQVVHSPEIAAGSTTRNTQLMMDCLCKGMYILVNQSARIPYLLKDALDMLQIRLCYWISHSYIGRLLVIIIDRVVGYGRSILKDGY